jgi:hypothetical protein
MPTLQFIYELKRDKIMANLRTITSVITVLFLAGCVSTPEPNPVSVRQDGDKDLDCKYLEAEYRGNTEAAARKISIPRMLYWVCLFGLDWLILIMRRGMKETLYSTETRGL